MENLGKFIFTLLLVTISALVSGFLLQTLWGWFVVDTFSLTPLTLAQSVGLTLIVSYFSTVQSNIDEDFTMQYLFEKLVVTIIKGLLVLFIGWVITLFL